MEESVPTTDGSAESLYVQGWLGGEPRAWGRVTVAGKNGLPRVWIRQVTSSGTAPPQIPVNSQKTHPA